MMTAPGPRGHGKDRLRQDPDSVGGRDAGGLLHPPCSLSQHDLTAAEGVATVLLGQGLLLILISGPIAAGAAVMSPLPSPALDAAAIEGTGVTTTVPCGLRLSEAASDFCSTISSLSKLRRC